MRERYDSCLTLLDFRKLEGIEQMKLFELTLVVRDSNKFEVYSMDKIEEDNLIHLLSQFQLVLIKVMEQMNERSKFDDSDILF